MTDLLTQKIRATKSRLEQVKAEVEKMEKDDKAGMLSPLDRMKLGSIQQEHKELQAKLRELLM